MPTGVTAFDNLTSPYEYLLGTPPEISAVTPGGFFFLADRASAHPRQLALNLSISNGHVRSLPTKDQEAVIVQGGRITAKKLLALGELTIGDKTLSWSGSNTAHETDVKVFSNGNAIVKHQSDEVSGAVRVLQEESRFTPQITNDDTVDVGFIGVDDGTFTGFQHSEKGGVDIFTHDFVIRCHKGLLGKSIGTLVVQSIDAMTLDSGIQGAFSAGPLLSTKDFESHPINYDSSLGNRPPFIEKAMARTVLYETIDGVRHIRLFDGRPSSPHFGGVTPTEAKKILSTEGELRWGCFLDPGQTAKLCIRLGGKTLSYGNRHYMKWPSEHNTDFVWVPDVGRPVANVITL